MASAKRATRTSSHGREEHGQHTGDRTRYGSRVREQSGQGKGQAVWEVIRLINAPIILVVNGDATYRPTDADAMLEPILDGGADDLVVSDQFLRERSYDDIGVYGHSYGVTRSASGVSIRRVRRHNRRRRPERLHQYHRDAHGPAHAILIWMVSGTLN